MPVSVLTIQQVPSVHMEGGLLLLTNKGRQSWNLWKKTHGNITLTLAKQHRNPQLATCNSNCSQQFWVIRMRNWTMTQEIFLLLLLQRLSKLHCIFFLIGGKLARLSPTKKKTTNICILVKSKCYWRWEPLGVLWTRTEATAPTQPLRRAAPPKCSKPQPWQTPPENT